MKTNRALLLRRTDTTLRISIPREYVKRQGLGEGDVVTWEEEEDGVRLKFTKLAKRLEELAKSAA